MLTLGSQIKYGNEMWTVGAVLWLGERYYHLVRGDEVAMIPAFMLEGN